MYNKREVINILEAIIKSGILKKNEFWISNKTALVLYGIKAETKFIGINVRRQIFNRILETTSFESVTINKIKMIYLNQDTIIYEDNRAYRAEPIKEGFMVETLNSIMSKKMFYADDNEDIKEIKDYLDRVEGGA